MIHERRVARLAVAALCLLGCGGGEDDNPFGESGELCDVAEAAATRCEANGSPTGFDCIGSFLGACQGDLADEWRNAWACIHAKCESGATQTDAEAACDAEGKTIPDACGSGVTGLGGGFTFNDAGAPPSP